MSMIRKFFSEKPHRILDILHEWESITFSQKPRRMMLILIGIVNIILLLISAWIISAFAMPGNEKMGFFPAVYNTLTMILDAGCIESIIADPGSANLFLIIFCLVLIVISMITFTGALIGYVSDFISNKIETANTNSRQLRISDHVVILGWNSRASEIVNDLLYCPDHQKVVVLTDGGREEILSEVQERLSDTIGRENEDLKNDIRMESWLKRKILMHRKKMRNNIDFLVREGDIFSSVQLRNIRLERAKAIIILCDNSRDEADLSDPDDSQDTRNRSDNRTVKTLMQVIDIASRFSSNDDQKVVVEVDNDWTERLVNKIIKSKQALGKCRVIPFRVHRVMGQLLCQFALMPELNMVYKELFSNKGATFYAVPDPSVTNPETFREDYLKDHQQAIPLTFIRDDLENRNYYYYMASSEKEISTASSSENKSCDLELNKNYRMTEKYVLILGTNSKIDNILSSFNNFSGEWTNKDHRQVVHLTVVDDTDRHLGENIKEKYPFVENSIVAKINDEDLINSIITRFITDHPEDSSILILSDDTARNEDVDAKALTYLIYVKDNITRARVNKRNEGINIDIIVEIIDPKHYDVIKSYDINNVVISNRYISKMVTQISENYALYSLYADIMTYDEEGSENYSSKEVYIKRAGDYFAALPTKGSSVLSVVKTTYTASRRFWSSKDDFAILLGYVDTHGDMHLFSGNLAEKTLAITPNDKLIMYSNH